jgi:hypothetical protein
MGLDMFLYRTAKVDGMTLEDYEIYAHINLKVDEENPMPEPMQKYCKPYEFLENYLRPFEEFAYWRKFNALHNWFVQNIQDGEDECQLSRFITKADIQKLLEDLLEEKLEPVQGLFFGSTAKDAYYKSDCQRTIEIVERILKEVDFDKEVLMYQSSW